MAGGGYDISASVSESATQGQQQSIGAFTVGGGLKIPAFVWYVAASLAALWVWKMFKGK